MSNMDKRARQNRAEQLRQQRREQMTSSAKKTAKTLDKKKKAGKIAGKIIAVILCVILAGGIATYTLIETGAAQKTLDMGSIGKDSKISVLDYQYYYMRNYNYIYQQAQYYSQYYSQDIGYDTTLSPEDQTQKTKDSDGNEITWVEYLEQQALSMGQQYNAYYTEAVNAGLKLDDTDKASIESQIDDIKDTAESYGTDSSSSSTTTTSTTDKKGYSINAYLRLMYGKGITEGWLRKELEKETLGQKFYNNKNDKYAASYSDSKVKSVFDKDEDTYKLVTVRVYKFSTSDDSKTVTANAKKMYAAVSDEKSFIKQAEKYDTTENYDGDSGTLAATKLKSDLTSSYSEDVATWAFGSKVKAGDKKMITDTSNSAIYIIYMVKPKTEKVSTVTVRHILFMTVDSSNNALSDDKIAAAKKNAKAALKEWKSDVKNGADPEDDFAKLANELTEDTGNDGGGIYENVLPDSMVTNFNDWIFDSSRKEGDCDIVETEYGYHVIYFVSKNGYYYDAKIRGDLADDATSAYSEKLLAKDEYKIYKGTKLKNWAEKLALKKINYLVEASNASSSSSSTSTAS